MAGIWPRVFLLAPHRSSPRPVSYRSFHAKWLPTFSVDADAEILLRRFCTGMTELRFLRPSPLRTRLQLSAAAWWLMWRAFMWKSTGRWKYINRWPPVNFQCLDFNAQCRFLEVDLFRNKISPTWCKPCTNFFFFLLSKQLVCAHWIHLKACSHLHC